MAGDRMTARSGLVPYLFYDDPAAMIGWYTTVFGFKEHARYTGENGRITNAELIVGESELWMDGNPPAGWDPTSVPWIGVWVEDPDAVYEHLRANDVKIDPPVDKRYGVRVTGVVKDPAGYSWGFMRRITP